MPTPLEPRILLAAVIFALIASGIDPVADRYTWFLETLPVMIGILLLLATGHRFPLTPLLYRLLALHALILIVGVSIYFEKDGGGASATFFISRADDVKGY